MTYTAEKPDPAESSEQLRARIPGWGVDLDPKDRPSFPREQLIEDRTGAHWDFPERQAGGERRERSIEHGMLPPVFGTVAPLHGVSGVLRRLAYRKYSEAHTLHWLLLVAGDRVDSLGSSVTSVLRGKPDNPLTETGILIEPRAHGLSSRLGRNRVDVKHQWMDPLIVGTPWVLRAGVVYLAVRGLRRGR
ncbi:MAG: hypothetical protein JWN88_2390 [Frankiales bacterium]|nr:hypothetical protein [Frankiales bacterium]